MSTWLSQTTFSRVPFLSLSPWVDHGVHWCVGLREQEGGCSPAVHTHTLLLVCCSLTGQWQKLGLRLLCFPVPSTAPLSPGQA